MDNAPIVICITGTMASGKGAVQYFLINKGFKHIRITDPIFEEMKLKKLSPNERKNWVNIDKEMRKKSGKDALAQIASKKIEQGERYVVCPIRHPEDIKYMKKNYKAKVIFVDAPIEDRFKRTYYKEVPSSMTLEEFKKRDDAENNPSGEEKEFLTNINECKKLSDFIIENKGTLNQLNNEVDKIMRSIGIPDTQDESIYEDFEM